MERSSRSRKWPEIFLGRGNEYASVIMEKHNVKMGKWFAIYTLLVEMLMFRSDLSEGTSPAANSYKIAFIAIFTAACFYLILSVSEETHNYRSRKLNGITVILYMLITSFAGIYIGYRTYEVTGSFVTFFPFIFGNCIFLYIPPYLTLIMAVMNLFVFPNILSGDMYVARMHIKEIVVITIVLVMSGIIRYIERYISAREDEIEDKRNKNLIMLSMIDELTKVKNRHALRRDFEEYKGGIILAYINIDDFEFYNNCYGHSIGDKMLIGLAKALSEAFGSDHVYRYNGDNFILMKPEADVRKFRLRFEEIQKIGRSDEKWHSEKEGLIPQTSAGIIWGVVEEETDLRNMLTLAEEQLSRCKKKRRGGCSSIMYDDRFRTIFSDNNDREDQKTNNVSNLEKYKNLSSRYLKKIIKKGKVPAVIYFNIKGLGKYNQNYGFEEGDRLLAAFEKILKKVFDSGEVCRYVNANFIVLTENRNLEQSIKRAKSLLDMERQDRHTSFQAGIYICEENHIDPMTAAINARMAADEITDSYATLFHYYRDDSYFLKMLETREYVLDNIEQAIEENWINVLYQPIIDTENGTICEMEALSRWNDPNIGCCLSPFHYIGVLEDTRLIFKHDSYILEQVLKTLRKNIDNGRRIIPVCVNLSRMDFIKENFIDSVIELVNKYEISPTLIHFEITESAMDEQQPIINQLSKLKKAGFEVWMDDFGSGYSALNQIPEYDFDVIKVDMRFLNPKSEDLKEENKIILKHIIQMCNELGIRTLVEGVETEDQKSVLVQLKCNKLQGYYYSRPQDIENVYGRFIEINSK